MSPHHRAHGGLYPPPLPRMGRMRLLADHLKHLSSAVMRDAHRATAEDLTDEVERSSLEQELINGHSLDPIALGDLVVDSDSTPVSVQTDDPRRRRVDGRPGVIRTRQYTAILPVSGDVSLMTMWPPDTRAPMLDEKVTLDANRMQVRIRFLAELGARGPQRTREFIDEQVAILRTLVDGTNSAVASWNDELPGLARQAVGRREHELRSQNAFAEGLGLPFVAEHPKGIPYRIRRRPKRRAGPARLEGGDYPLLEETDFLEVILQMRRWSDYLQEHPRAVGHRDEETLRDSLLHSLNSAWSGTAEAFSKLGKTDIRLVIAQAVETGVSDHIFKAECKIWEDAGSASEAFDQLVDRYLTNRETRGALVFFVRDVRLLATARERAVKRLVERHGAELHTDEAAGWPIVNVPNPTIPERTLRLAVVIIDVTQPVDD